MQAIDFSSLSPPRSSTGCHQGHSEDSCRADTRPSRSLATCATVGLAARAHTVCSLQTSLCVAMCSQAVGRPAQSLAWLFWTARCRTGRGVHRSLPALPGQQRRQLDHQPLSTSTSDQDISPPEEPACSNRGCNINLPNLVYQIDDHEATPTSSLNWVLCRSTRVGAHRHVRNEGHRGLFTIQFAHVHTVCSAATNPLCVRQFSCDRHAQPTWLLSKVPPVLRVITGAVRRWDRREEAARARPTRELGNNWANSTFEHSPFRFSFENGGMLESTL